MKMEAASDQLQKDRVVSRSHLESKRGFRPKTKDAPSGKFSVRSLRFHRIALRKPHISIL